MNRQLTIHQILNKICAQTMKQKKITGENLIIDENTNTTQTNSNSDTQNPDNKKETNNETLPCTI